MFHTRFSTELSLTGAITGSTNLRMQYDRFDDLITRKYGVVIKNWPLKEFCNPSAIPTRISLEVLLNAWESGVTQFQKLSQHEMNAWENEQFSSRITMMSSSNSPPPTSIPAFLIPTPIAPIPPTPITPVLPTSASPPESAPPSPTPPEMALLSELTEQELVQPASNLGHGTTPTSPSAPQPPVSNSQLVAEMIHLDPTLQSIDPALIMVGVAQGHHHSTTIGSVTNVNHPPALVSSTSQNKWKQGMFEIITPQSFDTRSTKKPRKERGTKRAKGNVPVAGGENTVPAEGIIR